MKSKNSNIKEKFYKPETTGWLEPERAIPRMENYINMNE